MCVHVAGGTGKGREDEKGKMIWLLGVGRDHWRGRWEMGGRGIRGKGTKGACSSLLSAACVREMLS